MFEQLAARGQLRAAAAVTAETTVTFQIADRRSGSSMIVGHVTGRTTGSVKIDWYASMDGGATYTAHLATATITGNGAGYLSYTGPLPPDVQVYITPSSFDGKLALYQRSAGLLAQGEQIE